MPCDVHPAGLAICRPGRQIEVHREEIGVRWCFHCRTRATFIYLVQGDVQPSWYEPTPSIRCSNCYRADSDLFPGRHRTWEPS